MQGDSVTRSTQVEDLYVMEALYVLEARATELLDATRVLRQAESLGKAESEAVAPAETAVEQAWLRMAHAYNKARELCQPPEVCALCGRKASVEIGWFDRESEFRCDNHIEVGHITPLDETGRRSSETSGAPLIG